MTSTTVSFTTTVDIDKFRQDTIKALRKERYQLQVRLTKLKWFNVIRTSIIIYNITNINDRIRRMCDLINKN